MRIFAMLILLIGFQVHSLPADSKPNFVFFLVDDLGYMDIGANNPDTFYETPHIDRLAREGMRFTNGYAASPVCSPTRFSIMTRENIPPAQTQRISSQGGEPGNFIRRLSKTQCR